MRIVLALILAFTFQSTFAQKFAKLDASPMDLASYKKKGETLVKVYYSRPQKNDREVFGKLVKYGKVWRLGANENTEITFATDVKINGITVKAGTYSMFAIPNENEWTIILNTEVNKWGHFFYSDKDDIVRINVPAEEAKDIVEAFSMTFDKSKNGATLYMAWDNVQVALPIEILN
jgi:cystathionine beta-lyase/cystathionine gamma-synthase